MPPALSKGGEEEILLSLFAHHCTQLIDSLLDAAHTSALRQPYAPMSGIYEEEENGTCDLSQFVPFLPDDVQIIQDIAKLRP
jgi:hypothetical protein